MVRLALAAVLASLLASTARGQCAALGAKKVSENLNAGDTLTVPSTKFVLDDGSTDGLVYAACAADKRVEITSVNVKETSTTPVKLTVYVLYITDANDANPTSVKTYTNADCYTDKTAANLAFAGANANPDKVDAQVLVECAIGGAPCAIDYDIRYKCVARTSCSAISPSTTVAINNAATTTVKTGIVDSSGNALSCTAATQRIDITSVTAAEATGGTVAVNVGYQSSDADFLSVKTYAAAVCPKSAAEADVRFGAKAEGNPDKVDPAVKFTCTGAGGAACSVKYKIVGACIAKSACTAISPSTTVAINNGETAIVKTGIVDSNNNALSCSNTQRIDITSVMAAEATGGTVAVNVGYQNVDADFLSVKTYAAAVCPKSAAEADVRFGAKAEGNPDKVNPAVKFTCTGAGGAACSVKYKIVGACIAKSACTAITSGTTVTINNGATSIIKTGFLDGGNALSCNSDTQRVEFTSVSAIESTGGTVAVDVGYQSTDADFLSVKTYATAVCPASAAMGDVIFGVKANGNPEKTSGAVKLTCTGVGGAACSVTYKIQAGCQAKSACPVITTAAETFTKNQVTTIALTKFVDVSGTAFTATTCPAGKRVEFVSTQFTEVNAASINIQIKYQKEAASVASTNQVLAKEFTGASCYNGAEADVAFGAKADAHPEKVNPVVMLECPSTTTDCSVKYKIVAKCVDVSTTCASLSSATAEAITKATTLTVAAAKITDANKAALACTATQRVDIVSVKVAEVNNALVNVGVKYQSTATPATSATAKAVTGVSCYQSVGTEVSFAKADSNPEKITPVVTFECVSGTTDCSVKYEVIGKCVDRSAACPALTTAAVAVAAGGSLTVASTSFLDSASTATPKAALTACGAGKRVDIVSFKVTEQGGLPINARVRYQKDAASTVPYVLKSYLDGVCYSSSAAADLSFASLADSNPEKVDASLVIECPGAAACSVKYEVVAQCVAVSTACSSLSTATAETIPKATKLEVLSTKIVDANKAALACTAAQRVNIVSVKAFEVNGATINVNVGYQKSAIANRLPVKSVAAATCYQSATGELSFASFAPTNPMKTAPIVSIECPSATTDCSVKYEVIGECAVAAAACPTLTGTAVTVAKGAKLTLNTTAVVDSAKAALACNATTQRADITSLTVVEANGAFVNYAVGYQKDDAARLGVKNATNVGCFQVTDVSFSTLADANPDKTVPVVSVECPSTAAADCSVQYELVGKCVAKSVIVTPAPANPTPAPTTKAPTTTPTTVATPTPTPTTTTKATELASGASTTMDYYTRAIAMVVSIVAGAAMMYMRH